MKIKKNNKKSFILKTVLVVTISSILIFTIVSILGYNENKKLKANEPSQQTNGSTEETVIDSDEDNNSTKNENLENQSSSNNNNEKPKKNNTKKEETPSKSVSAPASSGNPIANYDFTAWNKSCDPNLVVINKNNKIPSNFNLSLCNVGNMQVSTVIKPALENMFNDAKQNGISLWVASGYRSISRQKTLFDKIVSEYLSQKYPQSEAERLAATRVAKPETSEHHTGFAVDLNDVNNNFSKTKAFDWLIKNSAKYGFILRYNKDKPDITSVVYEPWHFRYVGTEHAMAMNQKNMCLEEYVVSLINK